MYLLMVLKENANLARITELTIYRLRSAWHCGGYAVKWSINSIRGNLLINKAFNLITTLKRANFFGTSSLSVTPCSDSLPHWLFRRFV
jgi:hypothetical protein